MYWTDTHNYLIKFKLTTHTHEDLFSDTDRLGPARLHPPPVPDPTYQEKLPRQNFNIREL